MAILKVTNYELALYAIALPDTPWELSKGQAQQGKRILKSVGLETLNPTGARHQALIRT